MQYQRYHHPYQQYHDTIDTCAMWLTALMENRQVRSCTPLRLRSSKEGNVTGTIFASNFNLKVCQLLFKVWQRQQKCEYRCGG